MNAIPSIESILLQVHQSLELPAYTSKQKASFAQMKRPMEKYYEQFDEILDGIYRALEIHKDKSARLDLSTYISNFSRYQKHLELNTWTFNADPEQVVWQLTSHSYISYIARGMAFWNLHDITDKGMPGGKFWYLPTETEDRSSVIMPVDQVCTWLLDLLGIPLDQIRNSNFNNSAPETLIRNIYYWKSGKVPRLDTIKNTFQDSSDIEFKGCLYVDSTASIGSQLETVTKFIQFKNLSSDDLSHEIPIRNPVEIERIISGESDLKSVQRFIDLMTIRYAQPTFKSIRQRLHIAKAVQDGYKRLLKYLCPGVSLTNPKLGQNKILQLCHIYKYIYNLTIEAYQLNHGEKAENEWFDNNLHYIHKNNLFLSVAPSIGKHSGSLLGELLTKRFKIMKPDDPLIDLFDESPHVSEKLYKGIIKEQELWVNENNSIVKLINKIRNSSPWKAFQKEDDYSVLMQVTQSLTNNPKAFNIGLKRLKELATSTIEDSEIIQLELNYWSEIPKNKRPKETQKRVEYLLEEMEQHCEFQTWKAPTLAAKAKHYIALNDFKTASVYYKKALDACYERSYGRLRGFIAKDTLATLLQIEKLNKNNHERYLREMMANDVFKIETVAGDLNTHFWTELYKPYHGLQKLSMDSNKLAR
ncbi:hypothetical protein [uncultured Psychrosphaera sp.]|uniref:hypothetical protein n=1 Tax=uncultured Psychrosphaera sp. TaxID=1403522 RepID=UPI0026380D90|nr:hypothetical protein [uncultured Psychrosphaera sp.]